MTHTMWPTAEHGIDFRITPPGSRGSVTLADGSEIVVIEDGRVTDDYLNYVIDAALPDGERPPAVVRYVGPQLYFSDQ